MPAEGVRDLPLESAEHLVEVERCALCGSVRRELRFEEAPFRVVRCLDCRLVYVTPRLRPEVLPEVYAADYWRSASPKTRGYADYVADAALYLATFRKRLRFVERFVEGPGRALEVGCAAGYFLAVLVERGWEVQGIEPSAEIARAAQARLGADRVHVGDLASARLPEGGFDLVALWDVVEHVPDPRALLNDAARCLAPGGVLVLETQNVDSAFARLLGARWHQYKHLEHLYHFSSTTIGRLLDEAGLDVVRETPRFAGKHVSLAFIRERATRVHPVLSWLLAPLAPLDARHAYVNVFDELLVVARKRA